jgi:hypothetical protein
MIRRGAFQMFARRGPGRIAWKALTVALSVIVLSALHQAGGRFIYCEMLHSVQGQACCDRHHELVAGPGAELRAPDAPCCHQGRLSLLPVAHVTYAPRLSDASLLTVLPASLLPVQWVVVSDMTRRWQPPPAGPPRYASEARARLMVFLT